LLPTLQKNSIEAIRLSRLYSCRLAPHAAFAQYPTLDALVVALSPSARTAPPVRSRLLCAVVADYQATPTALGPAILVHAFRAMLVTLSRSLIGVDDPDEADSMVVAGLLDGLTRVRPARDPERIAMYVRQETRRSVFAALHRDARGRPYETIDPDEPSGIGDPDAHADPESRVPLEDRLAYYRPTAGNVPDEQLLRAHALRGGLRRLTEHLFADASPRRRDTVYRQLLRRTERLVANDSNER
jgi:hypothetical protein